MGILSNLEPKKVWQYFEEITQVPRSSKKEEKIIAFLLDFAEKNNLNAKKDHIGNILISKPATPGMENVKSVLMQSHMDMVCEANRDIQINFDTDPITPVIDGEWVKAKGTTLGADDGIGMAAQMALLTDENIKHGSIECLFTVDEETGLTGAFEIKPGFFKSKILLNLDSEDEGEIFIGCAGGVDAVASFDYKEETLDDNFMSYKFIINGLKGGHSGDEIQKGLGNSNKIANRFLYDITNKFEARLAHFDGGNKRNAIPREAEFIFSIKKSYEKELNDLFIDFRKEVIAEIKATETKINLELKIVEVHLTVIDLASQINLTRALYACPHGVHAWSPAIPDFVETSTNLASVKFVDGIIKIVTSQRSSLSSGKQDINNMVTTVFELAGAKVESGDGYPGWAPNPDSEILTVAEKSYERLFGKKPVVRAIHAGLECGLFLEKYPDLDMISFGPTLRGVHSPDEKIEIKTVDMWWKHLLDVLENIPS